MKTRNLDTLKKQIGDVESFIRHRLIVQNRVTVLEVGCGLGVALSELADIFPQVSFYGINIKHYNGQIERPNITYLYGDAGQKIALGDDTVDFAFSQQTIQFIPNKIGCIMEVFRTLKHKGQFWFVFPPYLYGLFGTSICTVSDGERIMDLKDYLIEINNPNVVINKFQFNLREGVLTKKMIAIEKNTIEFDLYLDKHYSIDDLTSIDRKKEKYLATHYQLCPGATLPKSRKKVLIIANNPFEQIQNMFRDEKVSVSYMTSDTVFLADTPHTISIMFKAHKDLDIIGSELTKTLFDFFKHVKYDFVYIDECLFNNPNAYNSIAKIQEALRYKG